MEAGWAKGRGGGMERDGMGWDGMGEGALVHLPSFIDVHFTFTILV